MQLAAVDEDGIVIRVTWDMLKSATEFCPGLEVHDEETGKTHQPTIVDLRVWAGEVANRLNQEAENGDTPVTALFDRAFEQACEWGAEGVRIWGDEP